MFLGYTHCDAIFRVIIGDFFFRFVRNRLFGFFKLFHGKPCILTYTTALFLFCMPLKKKKFNSVFLRRRRLRFGCIMHVLILCRII